MTRPTAILKTSPRSTRMLVRMDDDVVLKAALLPSTGRRRTGERYRRCSRRWRSGTRLRCTLSFLRATWPRGRQLGLAEDLDGGVDRALHRRDARAGP